MTGSKSNQRHKIEHARAVVAQALGDAARREDPALLGGQVVYIAEAR